MFVKAVPVILDRLEEKIKTAAQKVELLRQENKLLHDENVKLNKELKLREKLIRNWKTNAIFFQSMPTHPK